MTVGRGTFQIETSVERDDQSHERDLSTPTLLRYGVSRNFELQTPWGRMQKGQVSLRHFVTNNTSRNALGTQTFENRIRTTGVVLTVSLTLLWPRRRYA